MTYRLIEETATMEIGDDDGVLLASCVCGGGDAVPNKGLGRARIAAWKTRHQDCTPGGKR